MNYTPIGILDLTGLPVVIDLPNNRVFLLKPDIVDRLTQFASRFPTRMLQTAFMNIYLQDTLHVITAISDSVFHAKFRITEDDIDQSSTRQLYIPVDPGKKDGTPSLTTFIALAMFTLAVSVVLWKRRQSKAGYKKGRIGPRDAEDKDGTMLADKPSATQHIRADKTEQITRFLESLPTAERELLSELTAFSRQGRSLDATDMNRILGVAQKDESIRKARRSKAIKTINDAFCICLDMQGDLILRSRFSDDKRIFTYQMNQKHMSVLSEVS